MKTLALLTFSNLTSRKSSYQHQQFCQKRCKHYRNICHYACHITCLRHFFLNLFILLRLILFRLVLIRPVRGIFFRRSAVFNAYYGFFTGLNIKLIYRIIYNISIRCFCLADIVSACFKVCNSDCALRIGNLISFSEALIIAPYSELRSCQRFTCFGINLYNFKADFFFSGIPGT